MPPDELEKEIADGVIFWVAEEGGSLLAEPPGMNPKGRSSSRSM
jgi:hypothetical protein